jgi:hypothetical protein
MESSEDELEGASLTESRDENGWIEKSKKSGTQKKIVLI